MGAQPQDGSTGYLWFQTDFAIPGETQGDFGFVKAVTPGLFSGFMDFQADYGWWHKLT